jgi:two-component system, cell cycle response regulator DivK
VSAKTVLLIEDSPDTREIYRTLLEEYGYQVLEAANGEEGLAVACQHAPDLVLMNISLPEVDGWTATTLLKGDPRTAAIPVVAVTAFSKAANRDRALEAGCDGYLDKPVGPQRVLEEVLRLIGPPRDGLAPATS